MNYHGATPWIPKAGLSGLAHADHIVVGIPRTRDFIDRHGSRGGGLSSHDGFGAGPSGTGRTSSLGWTNALNPSQNRLEAVEPNRVCGCGNKIAKLNSGSKCYQCQSVDSAKRAALVAA